MKNELIFLSFGICSQLPWNLFITASDYFNKHLIGNITMLNNQKLSSFVYFGSFFAITFNSISLVANLYLLKYKDTPLDNLINTSLYFMLSALFISAWIVLIDSVESLKVSESVFFVSSLVCLMISGLASQFFTNGILKLTANHSSVEKEKLSALISTGQGISGLFASILQLLTLLLLGEKQKPTFFYFFIGCVFIILNLNFSSRVDSFSEETSIPIEQEALISKEDDEAVKLKSTLLESIKSISLESLSIMFVFVVTLAVFPSIASLSPLPSSSGESKYFRPMLFLSYNLFSVGGRLLCQRIFIQNRNSVLVLCLLRLVLVPLFVFLSEDYVCNVILHGALGFSTGYLTSNIYALVSRLKNDVLFTIILLCYGVGLIVGSLVSLPLSEYYFTKVALL